MIGRAGRIAALVFGDPLRSPPPRTHTNTILCWRLSLAWSGHRDTLDLGYRAGPGPGVGDVPKRHGKIPHVAGTRGGDGDGDGDGDGSGD